jgi:hypothetical protein
MFERVPSGEAGPNALVRQRSTDPSAAFVIERPTWWTEPSHTSTKPLTRPRTIQVPPSADIGGQRPVRSRTTGKRRCTSAYDEIPPVVDRSTADPFPRSGPALARRAADRAVRPSSAWASSHNYERHVHRSDNRAIRFHAFVPTLSPHRTGRRTTPSPPLPAEGRRAFSGAADENVPDFPCPMWTRSYSSRSASADRRTPDASHVRSPIGLGETDEFAGRRRSRRSVRGGRGGRAPRPGRRRCRARRVQPPGDGANGPPVHPFTTPALLHPADRALPVRRGTPMPDEQVPRCDSTSATTRSPGPSTANSASPRPT